jgi:hypothetical protein
MKKKNRFKQTKNLKNRQLVFDIKNDFRDIYLTLAKKYGLGMEIMLDAVKSLDNSNSWEEFAREQRINLLRMDDVTIKIMNLVKEYYKIKAQEEG